MTYYEIIYHEHVIPTYNTQDLIRIYNDIKNGLLLHDYEIEIITIKDGVRTSNKKGVLS